MKCIYCDGELTTGDTDQICLSCRNKLNISHVTFEVPDRSDKELIDLMHKKEFVDFADWLRNEIKDLSKEDITDELFNEIKKRLGINN